MDGICPKLLLKGVDELVVDASAYAGVSVQSVAASKHTVAHCVGMVLSLADLTSGGQMKNKKVEQV